MKLWSTITSNYYLNIGILSWFLAQVIKTILTFISTKRVVAERLIGSGGMPSSHSAFTVSIAVAMARKLGYSSPEFALALAFALVVMYDAMGIRRAAGEQAKVLNKMLFEFSDFPWFLKMNKKTQDEDSEETVIDAIEDVYEGSQDGEPIADKELKEYLGHTPLEVVAGCILGIIVALLMPMK